MIRKILSRAAMLMTVCLTAQALSSCSGDKNYSQLGDVQDGEEIAVITTNKGVIKMRFFPDAAPKAVENFLTHAKDGYYDGQIFHRVIADFMIQGGDPTGTGSGGESIWGGTFGYETTPSLHHINGAVAMAHSTLADSNGSQFYIVQNNSLGESTAQNVQAMKDNPNGKLYNYNNMLFYLDETAAAAYGLNPYSYNGNEAKVSDLYPEAFLDSYLANGGVPSLDFFYTVFGQVFEGMDVVEAIATTATDSSDRPVEDVIIQSVTVETYGS